MSILVNPFYADKFKSAACFFLTYTNSTVARFLERCLWFSIFKKNFTENHHLSFKDTLLLVANRVDLTPIYYRFVIKKLSIKKKNFVFFNLDYFYKNARKLINLLYGHVLAGMHFFLFGEFNITQSFFSILRYVNGYNTHGQFAKTFGLGKKNLSYYFAHSLLHVLHYVFNVYAIVILGGDFTRYNLYAFRNTQFILISVASNYKTFYNFDYTLILRNLTPLTLYGMFALFVSLYFMVFFELKWRLFYKYASLNGKLLCFHY